MIGAAIVGLGWWGRTIQRELTASSEMRVVLGVDVGAQARAAAAAEGLTTIASFEEALARSDIEAVILCSPHKHHAEQIVAAAKAASTCSARSRFARARARWRQWRKP
jgi:predicted dehydrogenase